MTTLFPIPSIAMAGLVEKTTFISLVYQVFHLMFHHFPFESVDLFEEQKRPSCNLKG